MSIGWGRLFLGRSLAQVDLGIFDSDMADRRIELAVQNPYAIPLPFMGRDEPASAGDGWGMRTLTSPPVRRFTPSTLPMKGRDDRVTLWPMEAANGHKPDGAPG